MKHLIILLALSFCGSNAFPDDPYGGSRAYPSHYRSSRTRAQVQQSGHPAKRKIQRKVRHNPTQKGGTIQQAQPVSPVEVIVKAKNGVNNRELVVAANRKYFFTKALNTSGIKRYMNNRKGILAINNKSLKFLKRLRRGGFTTTVILAAGGAVSLLQLNNAEANDDIEFIDVEVTTRRPAK